ncbi:ABC transporter permease [Microbacterium xanthum]|uniref:ABC transporter permease n=1 Tax=Microbacterium xanthum TaxID=3079794 RepID=UPI002AD2D35C|nr:MULTISPECIES: ABC transporter permease [unclassified Microbacterium]MDZ8171846.1 ABC transporter permease [Microbacterium sp. KSW-48]MDZ8200051.1 ABC transporter permease [Microbacterium sp. SSW1-59]
MAGRGTERFLPPVLALPAVVGLALLVVPLAALLARVEWPTLWSDITSPDALAALRLSVLTGLAATACCVVLGVPLALVIARAGERLAGLLRAIVTIPLVLPPMVGGVALLYLFGRSGPVGGMLAGWGVALPFTTAAVVIAQTFVALPFLVLALEGALRTSGTRYETVAATLGAGRWRILWRVTLPLALPGIVTGIVLAFARAIGEFGATALFAGNAPGVTQTMPLAIYTAFNGSGVGQGTAVALSLLLLVTAVAVLLLVRGWRPGATR